MKSVIRALTAMTPAGIRNFQREVDLNYDPDADPDGRILDILNDLREEEETLLDNPQTPLNETRDQGGTFPEDDMTSEMYQRTQPQLFNAEMRNYP